MNVPTKEQKQWFWEQCGWEYDSEFDYWYPPGSPKVRGFYITYRSFEMDIDLNNLFKYAVPKLEQAGYKYEICATTSSTEHRATIRDRAFSFVEMVGDDDPALALFWAIYKALGGKE